MAMQFKKFDPKKAGITLASSLIVLSSALTMHHANAQDELQEEEVIVTGIRSSLKTAQDLKRNSDTFVDAISSKDIVSLPDRSVTEALQRVPGIAISRFSSPEDPDHFGTEGTGIVIRGLTQVRSEFNGRDTFSADADRGLSFEDVPPELMGAVLVNKNQTADMIEGGIAGTVNLQTRKPFDSDERIIAVTVDGQWGDLAEDVTPSISGLFSDRWETDAGEFGLLISLANSELEKQSHALQVHNYEFRPLDSALPLADRPRGFQGANSGAYTYDGTFVHAPDGLAEGATGSLVPNGIMAIMKRDSRERTGGSLAFQWENPDDTLLVTAEIIHSDATLKWIENTLKYNDNNSTDNLNRTVGQISGEDSEGNPLSVENYQFNSDGVFTSGLLGDLGPAWGGRDGTNAAPTRVPQSATWGSPFAEVFGHRYQADTRYHEEHRTTTDFTINAKWTPNDNWEVNFDYQRVEAETEVTDVTAILAVFGIAELNTRGGGAPDIAFRNPWALATQQNRNASFPSNNGVTTESYFTDPSSYSAHAIMDNLQDNEGTLDAFKVDGTYFMENGPFTKIMFGARQAKRDQLVKASGFNWAALAPVWHDESTFLDEDFAAGTVPNSIVTSVDWGDHYRGDGIAIEGGNALLHPSDSFVTNYNGIGDIVEPYFNRCDDWRPLNQRVDLDLSVDVPEATDANGNTVPQHCDSVLDADLNGSFLPSEVTETSETNQAIYVRADFEAEFGSQRLVGNVGLRYVRLETDTIGATTFPRFNPTLPAGASLPDLNGDLTNLELLEESTGLDLNGNNNGTPANLSYLSDGVNYLPASMIAFGNGVDRFTVATYETTHFLPSLNLKFELTDEHIIRFGVSKAIAKPDIGDRRNFVSIGTNPDSISFQSRPPVFGPQVSNTGEVLFDGNGDLIIVASPDIGRTINVLAGTALPVDANGDVIVSPGFAPGIGLNGNVLTADTSYVVQDNNGLPVLDAGGNIVLDANGVPISGGPDGIPDNLDGSRPNQQSLLRPDTSTFDEYRANAGNPFLDPMEAVQYDLSWEYYFADVGSITATVFYKDLKKFFITGGFTSQFTNNGVTEEVLVNGAINGGDATMSGFEFAYQQTYDFLPAPFDGLGVALNYTYIDASGEIPNSALRSDIPDLGVDDAIAFEGDLPLEQLSDETANFQVFYEKGKISTRLAYSWRSEHLVTTRDAISGLPVFNEQTGYLDANFRYNITDNVTIGMEFKNILDTETRTYVKVDGQKQLGRGWFIEDRRYILRLSAQF